MQSQTLREQINTSCTTPTELDRGRMDNAFSTTLHMQERTTKWASAASVQLVLAPIATRSGRLLPRPMRWSTKERKRTNARGRTFIQAGFTPPLLVLLQATPARLGSEADLLKLNVKGYVHVKES